MAHHYKTTLDLYERLLFQIEHGSDRVYWDDVHSHVEYYEADSCPVGPSPQNKGRQVGEFDIILVNYEDRNAWYWEVKTSPNHTGYGHDQVERAKQFFDGDLSDGSEWSVIGDVYLEPS